MKKDIHPAEYRPVVFQDTNADFSFLTRSTAKTAETIKWEDGKEYPLIKVHISSASHPFYTGEEKILDIEGRVDRFKAKQEAAKKKRDDMTSKAKKQAAKKAAKSEPEATKLGEKPAVKAAPAKNPAKAKPDAAPSAEQ
jgi:large subunit ribosomal protein L31